MDFTELKCGDMVWGYAFDVNNADGKAHIKLLPSMGKLHGYGTKAECEQFIDDCPCYFVPLDENGDEVWKKARRLSNVEDTASEEDAVSGYNARVDEVVERFVRAAERIAGNRITT